MATNIRGNYYQQTNEYAIVVQPTHLEVHFFQKNMYLNGCVLIADVCNMDGQVLSCDVLVEFFRHHCSFLDYYRLKTGLINYFKQAINARERALCQLTVCFEFQSRSDRRKKHKSCALEMVFGRKLRR